MKKHLIPFLFFIIMLPVVETKANIMGPVELTFQLYWDDTSISHNGPAKNPPETPMVYLYGYTLIFTGAHPDFTVQLIDTSGLVYQTSLSTLSTQLEFPATLSGVYELRLVLGDCFFATMIELGGNTGL